MAKIIHKDRSTGLLRKILNLKTNENLSFEYYDEKGIKRIKFIECKADK